MAFYWQVFRPPHAFMSTAHGPVALAPALLSLLSPLTLLGLPSIIVSTAELGPSSVPANSLATAQLTPRLGNLTVGFRSEPGCRGALIAVRTACLSVFDQAGPALPFALAVRKRP